jgi:hypothetical protein
VRAQDASVTPPLAYGSHLSKLLAALGTKPHEQVRLTEEERLRLVIWIDANSPYHDGFVNKRMEQPAYDLASDRELLRQITTVHQRRCAPCHTPEEISRLDWVDLHRPERTLFLSAPLAPDPDGKSRCPGAVYPDTNDADYQSIGNLLEAALVKARSRPRRDLKTMPALRSSN